MGEFFKPWRRKIGLLTLVMACLCAAACVRSCEDAEIVNCCCFGTNCTFASAEGEIHWILTPHSSAEPALSRKIRPLYIGRVILWAYFSPDWEREFAGFQIGEGKDWDTRVKSYFGVIPYWSIVIPQILISIWLFLSKPRPSTPQKLPEPAAIEGI